MSEDSSTRSSVDAEPGPRTGDRGSTETAPNTLLNGVIGGVIGVVLSFIPFSPVLGGGVAGYLEGGDYASGAKVGAVAGLVAFVPLVAIIGLGLAVVVFSPSPGMALALWVTGLAIVIFVALYAIGLSILGGMLGAYLQNEL